MQIFKKRNNKNDKNQEPNIRKRIVNTLVNYLLISSAVILIFIAFNFSSQDQKELVTLMWNSQIHLVNIAVGYYFGDRR